MKLMHLVRCWLKGIIEREEIMIQKQRRKRKKKMIDSHQGGNSPTLQGSLKSNDEQGIVENSQLGDYSIITRPGSFVNDNFVDSKRQHEKMSPKASRENRSNKHPSEHYHKGNGVASVMDNGKAANISEGRNGSLAAPGSIFSEGCCESSEDEGGHAISDASTKTPSDYTVSSDSDGENNANLTSPQDGSKTLGGKRSRGRSIKRSCSSSAKDLALDAILRSSSKYKKAKLSAS